MTIPGQSAVPCSGSNETRIANLMGEAGSGSLRLAFDRRLMLQCDYSDGGLLVYRELDVTLGLPTRAPIRSPTRARTRTAAIHWSAYCASRCSDSWPAVRMCE